MLLVVEILWYLKYKTSCHDNTRGGYTVVTVCELDYCESCGQISIKVLGSIYYMLMMNRLDFQNLSPADANVVLPTYAHSV